MKDKNIPCEEDDRFGSNYTTLFFFFLKKHSFILKGCQNVMTFIGPLTFSGKYLQMPGFVLAQLLVCSIESFVKHLLSATYLGSKDETQTRHTRQLIFCFVLFCFFQLLLKTMEYFSEVFRLRMNEVGKHLSS